MPIEDTTGDGDASAGAAQHAGGTSGQRQGVTDKPELDLVVVMPVYNEEGCIAAVVESWLAAVESLGIRARLKVLNDGSSDGTAAALNAFRADPRVSIIDQPNSGHGPTILRGYRAAVREAEWVFQVDSDGELEAVAFRRLWLARDGYDGVFGVRVHRSQSMGRRTVSVLSRTVVRVLFGGAVTDVNAPFRLMRSSVLTDLVERIPPSTFAPNVIIAGEFGRQRCRVLNVPVPHRPRQTGTSSVASMRLLRLAARSAIETLRYRLRVS